MGRCFGIKTERGYLSETEAGVFGRKGLRVTARNGWKRMSIIKTDQLAFEYIRRDEEGNVEGITRAVDDVSLEIEQGDFIAILGHNGSGKSTLAKHMNAILYPTEGTIWVDGKDTNEDEYLWDIRQTAGMVFQNPDNQIIGQIVEEDVGFGPENMGVPTKEIWERVEESLKAVGMYEYRKHSRISFPAGRSSVSPLPASLRCIPNASFWTSLRQC